MALFPAYAYLADKNKENIEDSAFNEPDNYPDEATESQLLVSDENSEDEKTNKDDYESAKSLCNSNIIPTSTNFYIDCKLDYGNLRVSTLYYPGRPQYEYYGVDRALGERDHLRESRKRRYYSKRIPDEPEAPAVAERTEAYRLLIAQTPDDIMLWERYIDFQEACGGEEAALRAAEEAAARLPAAARLRRRRLAALRRALPPHRYLERLRDMLANESFAEKCAETRTCLWEHLLEALAATPECGAAGAAAAAAAALRGAAGGGGAPALLHAAGAGLRAAGHWERLVLLLDLLVAMNYAPATLALPDAALQARADRSLADLEDKVTTRTSCTQGGAFCYVELTSCVCVCVQAIASGLPLSAVWVRVERARAAAHWAPVGTGAAAGADPQRAPLAHDVAELLQPVAGAELARLSLRLLALAQVPALPGTQWAARLLGGAARADCAAEALLPLLEAARALPPAHPAAAAADPALASRVLALLLDPPHYFTDDNGYLSWVNSLWDACIARAGGGAAVALLCWRLRWLRALLALAPRDAPGRREAARLRAGARALLRPPPASPLPAAEFARVEREAAGATRALHVATQALRAALADPDCPRHHAIYIARVVCEVSWEGGPQESAAGACALVCAVLGRVPPAELAAPVPADLDAALDECERRCAALEHELEAGGDAGVGGGEGAEALLPGAGEWARARAALAPPSRRERLLRALRGAAARARAGGGAAAARYWEEGAEALCGARGVRGRAGGVRAAQWARTLAPLFSRKCVPRTGAGAPLWALWARGEAAAGGAEGDVGALAALLPPLLRALRTDFAPTGDCARKMD
ncbi:unnamed protein product, partial [Brenthis ino]